MLTHVNSQHIAHRHNIQSLVESLDDKKKKYENRTKGARKKR
jgi:predicted phage-related endonuclease